jgi:arylsulfatase A-like enzyme
LGKKDPKKRAARFEALAFPSQKWNAKPIQKKANVIVMPPFSQLDYYICIPQRSFLQWDWEYEKTNQKGSRDSLMIEILIQEAGGLEESLFKDSIDPRSRTKKPPELPLDRFADKVVRLSFRCESTDTGDGTAQSAAVLTKAKIKQKAMISQGNHVLPKASLDCKELDDTNILLVLLDAASPSRMSCYGYEKETTPVIDRIADEGILFTKGYAQASWTVPSVASLFTSTHPITHKVWSRDRVLTDKAFTLAEALKKKGFTTIALTATSSASSLHNLFQGFDHQKELYKLDPKELQSGKRLGVVWAEDFVSPAIDCIRQYGNQKFFMYLHYIQPHTPYNPPAPFADTAIKEYSGSIKPRRPIAPNFMEKDALNQDDVNFIGAMYDANLEYVDFQLGKILDFFKTSALYENTVIIITSDHGEAFLEHGDFGHSSSLYEEEIHIPLIVKFPGRCNLKGKRMDSLVQSIDIMPTLLDILGTGGRTKNLQGKSLIPLISGLEREVNKFVFASLSKAFAEAETKADSLSDGRFKLLSTSEERMLFDLDKDPGETVNIFFDHPILARYYEQRLAMFKQHYGSRKDLSEKGSESLDETTKKHLKALGYIK